MTQCLLSVMVVRLRCYDRPFVTKCLVCCAKSTSPTKPGPILRTGTYKFQRYGREVTENPSECHLAPSYFLLFWLLRSTWLASEMKDARRKQGVTSWLQTRNNGFLYAGIQASKPRRNKSFIVTDDYSGVWCKPPANHVSYIHQIQSKMPGITMIVTLFYFQTTCDTDKTLLHITLFTKLHLSKYHQLVGLCNRDMFSIRYELNFLSKI
jgi:hypothetical protein